MGIFHYNEGNRLLRKGDWKKAVQNYKMALKHDKNLQEVYTNLSTAYLKGGKYIDALKVIRDLEKRQPQNPLVHYNLACYYSLVEETVSALKSLQQAVKLGFKSKQQIQTDSDLKNLRNDKSFQGWFQSF